MGLFKIISKAKWVGNSLFSFHFPLVEILNFRSRFKLRFVICQCHDSAFADVTIRHLLTARFTSAILPIRHLSPSNLNYYNHLIHIIAIARFVSSQSNDSSLSQYHDSRTKITTYYRTIWIYCNCMIIAQFEFLTKLKLYDLCCTKILAFSWKWAN